MPLFLGTGVGGCEGGKQNKSDFSSQFNVWAEKQQEREWTECFFALDWGL